MRRERRLFGILAAALVLFTLPPASPAGTAAHFTRLDLSSRRDKFSFLVYGDIQDNFKKGHQALVRQMLTEEASLVFNTGDVSDDGGVSFAGGIGIGGSAVPPSTGAISTGKASPLAGEPEVMILTSA